ncbi:hypothetical protein [Bacillus sp. EAC]|uniref:hypothetical protein n=1 Tax=Bacillus sp. EAC TaxID=1978338 RepID=UPI001C4E940C|nr:hypothetical protein [Bacillus sp. EAC]
MKIKQLMYYMLPIFLTMILSICVGIPQTLAFSMGWFFMSIFTFGIPILILASPYLLYFFCIGKIFEKSNKLWIWAMVGTTVVFIVFLVISAYSYKPIENKMYFTNDTITKLSNESLTLYEERTHMKGKVGKISKTSALEGWNDVEVSGLVEGRELKVIVKSTVKEKGLTIIYHYQYKNGKWVMVKQS